MYSITTTTTTIAAALKAITQNLYKESKATNKQTSKSTNLVLEIVKQTPKQRKRIILKMCVCVSERLSLSPCVLMY